MTAQDIIKDFKNKKYKPVYLLQGEEPYFIDLISNYAEHRLLADAEKGFNQTVFYGKDTDITNVLNAAKRYPMMADHQLVIVKEAQDMKWGSEEPDKKGNNPFLYYLENPLQSTILIFCYKHGKFDKRKKAFKAIEKKGLVFESSTLHESKIPAWVEAFVLEKGYKMNSRASAMLAEYLGNDLTRITNELEKLMLNVTAGQEITIKEIHENIGISKEYNVFELQAALGKKDVYKTNQIINYFEANPKANPLMLVLGNLNNFFSKVLLYHYAVRRSQPNIAGTIGVNPYFVKDYEQAARSFNIEKTASVIGILREYDLKSKGVDSNAGPGELMREMIFKILH